MNRATQPALDRILLGLRVFAAFLVAVMLSACAAKPNPDDPANAPHVAVVKVERRERQAGAEGSRFVGRSRFAGV